MLRCVLLLMLNPPSEFPILFMVFCCGGCLLACLVEQPSPVFQLFCLANSYMCTTSQTVYRIWLCREVPHMFFSTLVSIRFPASATSRIAPNFNHHHDEPPSLHTCIHIYIYTYIFFRLLQRQSFSKNIFNSTSSVRGTLFTSALMWLCMIDFESV